MAKDQTYLLVEMATGEHEIPKLYIHQIIRTYYSERRAQEDHELLEKANRMKTYAVLTVPHIDN